MKRLTMIIAVVGMVGVWPAASSAATFHGVVVANQHGSLLVASPSGVVRVVTGSASLGSRVALAGGRATVTGRAHTARIRGVVVGRVGTTMFISSNRHLVAVHTGRRLAAVRDTTPTPTTTTPSPGTVVSSQVTIQNGELDEDSSETVGQIGTGSLQVQAVVAAVGAGTVTLTVGAQTLTVALPGGLTLPASLVGQTVTLSVSLDDQGENDDGDHSGHGHGGGDDGGGDD